MGNTQNGEAQEERRHRKGNEKEEAGEKQGPDANANTGLCWTGTCSLETGSYIHMCAD
jgi:hypothetical protein